MERYCAAIAEQLDLEPNRFEVIAHPVEKEKLVAKAKDNIFPLAYGCHEIVFDREELEQLAKQKQG